ncbi:beta-N-acetylhexosaminidase [Rhodobacter ferrooxidans]|uniref:beta-N-acetylhexosaminidase n=1 Tax=Rhodobacter ferrooxidans TaxID=371731 RepID=C8RZL5_9RHOB|nr:beta-N-acetylhexosaminidase [Rhodobacter sp. SW2]EEW25812.1 Beta-N-acetylhexosaminidase [Rhodobacter sp. SW2]
MSSGGATVLGCAGTALTAAESDFFRDADPFGFILFARNVETPEQLRRLTGALRAAVGRDAPVFVDQEGGRVQRLRAPHWREWLPPMDAVAQTIAAAPAGQGLTAAARMLWLRYRLIAAELRSVGIDGNCAPCADVLTPDTHPFLKNRCYSDDPRIVALLSRAVAEAHLAGGVLPVVKHLPGHGRAVADSHLDLPRVTVDAETLESSDFAAFRPLRDLPLAMTAHIVFTAYDDQPATCSAPMIKVIRDNIGFAGLLLTDDLNMQALPGTLAEKTTRSLAAGCDIALHCKGDLAEMQQVVAAAGSMGPATQARAQAAIAARHAPDPVDIAALEAEHAALLNGQGDG